MNLIKIPSQAELVKIPHNSIQYQEFCFVFYFEKIPKVQQHCTAKDSIKSLCISKINIFQKIYINFSSFLKVYLMIFFSERKLVLNENFVCHMLYLRCTRRGLRDKKNYDFRCDSRFDRIS